MKRGLSGSLIPQSVNGRDYESFLPKLLPPEPDIQWSSQLIKALAQASESVARLDGAARLLPDLNIFLYSYVRKEAVLSSQIEGTQSSLSDLLMFESSAHPGVPIEDVNEVVRYLQALHEGVHRVQLGEQISMSLILDMHKTLLSSGRGSDKDPGFIRDTQNWIGGLTPDRAKFVPPPPEYVNDCLNQLLSYWKCSQDHTLIKAALIHLQFETIHPFRDGNGRIGRLLITLILSHEKLISQPLVYLSLYFKENRNDYYDKLQLVRMTGDWEDWILFFLTGVKEVTDSAFETINTMQKIFEVDLQLIRTQGGRKAASLLELYSVAQQTPIFSIPKAVKLLKGIISKPTVYTAAEELVKLGILNLTKDESGTQLYTYQNYINILK